jgi:Uncharacterized conserved protein
MATTPKEALALLDSLKGDLDALRPLKPEQEQKVFQKLRLDWNYHSNAIEGNQLTLGETRLLLMEGVTAHGKPLKDYLDIKGHNHVIDFLLDFIHRKEVLTEATIREMHRLLLVQPYEVTAITPEGGQTKKWVKLGQYKEEPNQVKTPTGEIRRFVLPSETPERMRKLVLSLRDYDAKKSVHPIPFAAVVHHEFVSIHPFDDGNGRLGRVLMNLILMQYHYPPAVIRMQDRERYFFTLAQGDNKDLDPLVLFIAEQVSRSLELYIRAAKNQPFEEHDDIDKKITLLAKELDEQPEPKPLDGPVYAEFITGSFTRLVTRVVSKLRRLDEFYLKSSLFLQRGDLVALPKDNVALAIKNTLVGSGVRHHLTVRFTWESFKKAGTRAFNDSVDLIFGLQPLTYSIHWGRNHSLTRLYANELRDEDCVIIANEIAEDRLKLIDRERALAS